jgi:hypothetical protein
LEKIELNFIELSDDLLSPGNIYWRQKSGVEIKISSKADVLNFEMLRKLSESNKVLLIEDSIEYSIHTQIKDIFNQYENEIHFKKKIQLRSEFNSLLYMHYYQTEKPQFELDQLCWKIFSEINRETGIAYLNRDRDFFKRAMNIATSYVICAFLIGYYDGKFLRKIYNSTILNLMLVGKNRLIGSLKEDLEILRKKSTMNESDKEFIGTLIDINNFEQSILFEKFDGSGPLTLKMYELSDLELVLCSLNYFYQVNYTPHRNILAEIRTGSFGIENRLLNLIRKNFEIFIINEDIA